VQTTWHLTAPSAPRPAGYAVSAQATLGNVGHIRTPHQYVAYPSFNAAFNNVGITNDTSTSAGNFDGGGASYSAQALAARG